MGARPARRAAGCATAPETNQATAGANECSAGTASALRVCRGAQASSVHLRAAQPSPNRQIMLLVSPSMHEQLLQRFDKFIFPADKVEVRRPRAAASWAHPVGHRPALRCPRSNALAVRAGWAESLARRGPRPAHPSSLLTRLLARPCAFRRPWLGRRARSLMSAAGAACSRWRVQRRARFSRRLVG